jgi:hypothetical protein
VDAEPQVEISEVIQEPGTEELPPLPIEDLFLDKAGSEEEPEQPEEEPAELKVVEEPEQPPEISEQPREYGLDVTLEELIKEKEPPEEEVAYQEKSDEMSEWEGPEPDQEATGPLPPETPEIDLPQTGRPEPSSLLGPSQVQYRPKPPEPEGNTPPDDPRQAPPPQQE